jgi:hypothetical protein
MTFYTMGRGKSQNLVFFFFGDGGFLYYLLGLVLNLSLPNLSLPSS